MLKKIITHGSPVSRLPRGTRIVLDIGGTSKSRKGYIAEGVIHPIFGNALIFSVNANSLECPAVVDDVIDLKSVPDNSVDGIYSSHTIEHISSHHR